MDSKDSPDDSALTNLSTGAIIGISCASALALLILIILFIWCLSRGRNSPDKTDNVQQKDIQLPTLGNTYTINSVPSVIDADLYSRNNSISTTIAPIPELKEESQAFPEKELLLSKQRNQDSNAEVLGPVKAYLELPGESMVDGRARSDSVYLNFQNDLSRKNSTTSQHFTMKELEEQSRRELGKLKSEYYNKEPGQAPLAISESLHSLNFQSSVESLASKNIPDRKEKSRDASLRPTSEPRTVIEGGRFRPKLPPKKKRILHHKSTNDMVNISVSDQQNVLTPSKSETCILQKNTEGDLSDYDDLPSASPHLPPKLKPRLPAKQKINKSEEDLVRIERQLKTSMTDLQKSMEHDLDYDDVPDPFGSRNGTAKQDGRISGIDFEDYDDLPHHHSGNRDSGLNEHSDYDDPISHSGFPTS